MAIDPVGLEIIWSRLTGILDEGAAQFVRTSFSPLVRDSNDFAIVVTDASGRALGQSSLSIPSFIGTLPASVKAFLDRVDSRTLTPDALYVSNDPWFGTGHIHDATLIAPIFMEGALQGFAAIAHHLPDIGGRIRGVGNRDIFEEGLQIPLTRLHGDGRSNDELIGMIERNVRTPAQTMGDIWAGASVCNFLRRRLAEFLPDYGLTLTEIADHLIERSASALAGKIDEIPDGEYYHETFHDGFEHPIRVACRVVVSGSRLAIDLTGSSPQQPFAVNVVPAYAKAYLAFALKAVLDPDLPNNEGLFLPLSVDAPRGCIFNPDYPAATGARAMMGHMLVPAFMCALARALPHNVVAEGAGVSVILLSGETEGRPYNATNFVTGGQGASAAADGMDAICFPSNLSNSSVEIIERQAPVRVHHRRLRKGSGGRGAHRGGDGIEFELECLDEAPVYCSLIMTRAKIAPLGLMGGEAGKCAEIWLNNRAVDFSDQFRLMRGDVLTILTAGGGGYGQPGRAS